MDIIVDGERAVAATGDSGFDPGRTSLIFIHGAGLDRTIWALQARNPAFARFNVLAVDLPAHGMSAGAPLTSIPAMADWLVRLLDARGIARCTLVGHSMGALVALDLSGRYPDRVEKLALLGIAFPMAVAPMLLDAARDDPAAAAKMIVSWGFSGGLGDGPAPGLRMTGAGMSLLKAAKPGVLHRDLAACNAYEAGLERARAVTAPALLLLGGRDRMTRPKAATALAEAMPTAETVILGNAGHMMMSEASRDVIGALKAFL